MKQFRRLFSTYLLITILVIIVFSSNTTCNAQKSTTYLKAAVIELLKATEYDNAIELLEQNMDVVQNDTTGLFEALTELYIYRDNWQDILKINQNRIMESDSTGFLLSKAFSKYPKQIISFTANDTISIETNKFNATLIDVVINGVKYKFWFDTGCPITVISSKVAKKCGVKEETSYKIEVSLTGSSSFNSPGVINSLLIGNVKLENHKCLIIDKKALQFRVLGIPLVTVNGIIGWNFFKNFDVTLNDKNKTLILKLIEQDETQDKNFFWFVQPYVRATDDKGDSQYFIYDTGATHTIFYDNYLHVADTTKAEKKIIEVITNSGKENIEVFSFPKVDFKIGGQQFTFKNVTTTMLGESDFLFFDIIGLFGKQEVKEKIIQFNAEQGYFIITE
jgi:predicted aspartyl protease